MTTDYKYATQDKNGCISLWTVKPHPGRANEDNWCANDELVYTILPPDESEEVENWEGSFIDLEESDFDVVNKRLIRKPKKERHPHAEIMMAYAKDWTTPIQWFDEYTQEWLDCDNISNLPTFQPKLKYRIKPDFRKVRIFKTITGELGVAKSENVEKVQTQKNFVAWLTNDIECEI